MDADGSNQTRLTYNETLGGDRDPSLSPDGSKIAFVRNGEIYVMKKGDCGGSPLTNPTTGSNPAWSLDGAKLAFVRQGEVWVMNADGSNQTNLTNNPASDDGTPWSPDAAKIAFQSNRDGNAEIYTMDADGSNQTRLTYNSPAQDLSPSWSPDGNKIVFASNRVGGLGLDIWVMNADGSNQTNLTNTVEAELNPVWSPDGTKIAFQRFSLQDGLFKIWVIDADGSNQTQLTTQGGNEVPDWGSRGPEFECTAPTTTAAVSPEPNGAGWNKEDVTVMLSATDNEGGSGVKEITYRVDGGQPTVESGNTVTIPPITAEGYTTITYHATDNEGNVEADKTLTISLDRTGPTVESVMPENWSVNVPRTTNVNALITDYVSGVDISTFDPRNVKLERIEPGRGFTEVPAEVSYDPDTEWVTIDPSSDLSKLRVYKATITTGVVNDFAGNPLAENKVWFFRTGR